MATALTLDEARLAAHRHAMAHDRRYRAVMDRITAERREVQTKRSKREGTRRMWSLDGLVMPRAFMRGPRWRRAFGVKEMPIADVDPQAAPLHRPGRKLLMFSLEDDVRELVLEPIRHDVVAEWSDPRERL